MKTEAVTLLKKFYESDNPRGIHISSLSWQSLQFS